MAQAAGYTLELYCDNASSKTCPYNYKSGAHGEYVSNEVNCKALCYREARADGWNLSRRGGIDLCPKCYGKPKKQYPQKSQESSGELNKALTILLNLK